MLELKNICKNYDIPGTDEKLKVLNDLSLKVDIGESIAILGPSGSGKSTLLNIIGNLDKVTSGEVIFEGANISSFSETETSQYRNKKIGFVFQLHHLLPQCTLLENVLIPTLFDGKKSSKEEIDRANILIDKIGLSDRKNYHPGLLSGGELQRTAVARALINSPKLILADEPTGSLDHNNAVNLVKLLKEMDNEVAIIMVTHSEEIADFMDKTFRLTDGKLEEVK